MNTSNEYLNHCLNVLEADKNVSRDTFAIMLKEYAKLQSIEMLEWYNETSLLGIDSKPKELFNKYEKQKL